MRHKPKKMRCETYTTAHRVPTKNFKKKQIFVFCELETRRIMEVRVQFIKAK